MQYLQKICCFFIFARIFLHMCPNEKYEKYVSALTSWVAFCIFLSPFLSGELVEQSYQNIEKDWKSRFEFSMEDRMEDFEEESVRAAEEISAASEMEELVEESKSLAEGSEMLVEESAKFAEGSEMLVEESKSFAEETKSFAEEGAK